MQHRLSAMPHRRNKASASPLTDEGKKHLSEGDAKRAVRLFRDAAAAGCAEGESLLAECYLYGRGVRRNVTRAESIFARLVENGHVDAKCKLAMCYLEEVSVERVEKATELLKDAARNGCADAQYNLAVLLLEAEEEADAMRFFEMAGDAGDAHAKCNIGILRVEKGDINAGIALLQSVTMSDDTDSEPVARASAYLGYCAMFGVGVLRDEMKAAALFERAADSGDCEATLNLAMCYNKGLGVPRDDAKAFELFEEAAAGGDVDGMHELGRCYRDGRGVDRDYARAVELLTTAVQGGCVEAMCELARFYENGTSVKRSVKMALSLYRAALGGGEEEAALHIERLVKLRLEEKAERKS